MKIKLFVLTLCFALCIAGGVAVAGKTINNLNQTNSSLQTELDSTKKTYSCRIDELTEYQEGLVVQLNDFNTKLTNLQANYNKLDSAYTNLQSTYDNYVKESKLNIEKLNQELSEVKTTLASLEADSEIDKAKIEELKTKISNLEKSINDKNVSIEQLNSTIETQKSTIADLNNTIEDLQKQIEDMTTDLNTDIAQFIATEGGDGSFSIGKDRLGNITKIRAYAFSDTNLASIELPDTVTSIGNFAFYNCSKLTNIKLSNNLTSIGNSAFKNTSISDLVIPNSVTTIGSQAFHLCSALKSITMPSLEQFNSIRHLAYYFGPKLSSSTTSLPSSYPSSLYYRIKTSGTGPAVYVIPKSLEYISISSGTINSYLFCSLSSVATINVADCTIDSSEYLFYGCSNLTKLNLPTAYPIADSMFSECSSITNVVIPDGTKTIGYGAFSGCSSLTNVTIPNGVESIGSAAFNICRLITSITLPDTLKIIGSSAFASTSISNVTIPSSVVHIGNYAFSGTPFLKSIYSGIFAISDGWLIDINYSINTTSIVVPNGIKRIYDNCFSAQFSLTNITLPNTLEFLGSNMFGFSSKLTKLELPASVNEVCDRFLYNSSISELTINATTPISVHQCSSTGNSYIHDGITKIYVPAESVEAYKADEYWSNYAEKIVAIA